LSHSKRQFPNLDELRAHQEFTRTTRVMFVIDSDNPMIFQGSRSELISFVSALLDKFGDGDDPDEVFVFSKLGLVDKFDLNKARSGLIDEKYPDLGKIIAPSMQVSDGVMQMFGQQRKFRVMAVDDEQRQITRLIAAMAKDEVVDESRLVISEEAPSQGTVSAKKKLPYYHGKRRY